MHHYWNLSNVFLIRLALWVFRRKITEVECHFHHIMSSSLDFDLDQQAVAVFVSVCFPLSPSVGKFFLPLSPLEGSLYSARI